jgi:hypothetical protein
MVNVISMKWGNKYGPDYVNILKRMVSRNLARPHRFVCFTDDATGVDKDVETRPLPPCNLPSDRPSTQAWRKISLYSPTLADLTGPTLFLDLDVVVTGSLDPFFDYEPERFCVIHNWTHPEKRVGNTTCFRYEIGKHAAVFEEFNNNPDAVTALYRNSQTFVSERIDAAEGLVWWPDEWCKSFKKHCLPKGILKLITPARLPEGTRILAFHGEPNPPEAAKNWVYKGHHFMRPAKWINDYWK